MPNGFRYLKILISILCFIYLGKSSVSGQILDLEEHHLAFKNHSNKEIQAKSAIAIGQYHFELFHTDSAVYYSNEAIHLAKEINNEKLLFAGYKLQGSIEQYRPDFNASDSLLRIAYTYANTNYLKASIILLLANIDQRKEDADSLGLKLIRVKELLGDEPLGDLTYGYHHKMSLYYILTDRYYEGIKELLYLRRLTDDDLDKKHRHIDNTLAWVYVKINANEAAIPIMLETLEINKKNEDHQSTLNSYFGLATAYFALDRFDEGKGVCFEAMKLHEKHKVSVSFGYIYACLGDIFTHDNKPDSAIYYLNKGLELSQLQNEPKEHSDNLLGLAAAYMAKGDIIKAEEFANQTIAIKGHATVEVLDILSKISESRGNFKKALEYKSLILEKNKQKQSNSKTFAILSEVLKESSDKKAKEVKLQNELENRTKLMKFLSIFIGLIVLGFIYVIVNQKISEKKLKGLNDRLTNKNSALQHFSYICSHDLKEPIRTISSFSGLIEKKLSKENLEIDYQEYFTYIRNSVDSVSNIINSLHLFTQINTKQEYLLETISAENIVKQLKNNLKALIDEKKAIISFANFTNSDYIKGSEVALTLILQNLIQNGLKYNDKTPPKIDITLSAKGENLLFKIKDNGIGISEEFLEHIFLPFKTLDSKSKTNSSGLGLAICSRLASNIKGTIEVESEPNEGSIFTLCFKKG